MKTGAKKSRTSWGLRGLLVTLIALAAAMAGLVRYAYQARPEGQRVGIDAVYRLADAGRVLRATLLDQDAQIVGQACPVALEEKAPPPAGSLRSGSTWSCPQRLQAFWVSYPGSDVSTQALIERLSGRASVSIDRQTAKSVAKLLSSFVLPLLILVNLFGLILVSRSEGDAMSDVIGFGTLRHRRERKRGAEKAITFADVAGADEAVTELREVIDYLGDPKRFEAYGAAVPKGVLLFGPPGCGKTLVARAVAGESHVPFISISGTEFVESLVGVGAARVRDLFAQVRLVAPAIVFIDEIDAVGRRREGEGFSGGEREQTLNQLLVELDGFDVSAGVVVMGATNRPDILDPALMRPGRFDRHVTLEPPDVAGRQAILAIHAKSKPLAPEVDLTAVARSTSGFTGADLANVLNEAALLAIRNGPGTPIGTSQMNEAVQRVLHGPRRRGQLMTAEEHKRIAYHEAGHALVATALGQGANVARVSVVARGQGLGQSGFSSSGERVLRTTSELEADLAVALAGVAAEQLTFGESSTTARHDVTRATSIAKEMVGIYGMSERLGRVQVLTSTADFLGGGTELDAVSGDTMARFDDEVRRLIATAEQRASELLAIHRAHLEAVVERLEDQETVEGATLAALLAPVRPEMNLVPASPALNGARPRSRARAKPSQP